MEYQDDVPCMYDVVNAYLGIIQIVKKRYLLRSVLSFESSSRVGDFPPPLSRPGVRLGVRDCIFNGIIR